MTFKPFIHPNLPFVKRSNLKTLVCPMFVVRKKHTPEQHTMSFNFNLPKVTSIIYPALCLNCNCKISSKEQAICLECDHNLPRTNFQNRKENQFLVRFWGRIPVHAASAMYLFNGNESVRKMIHELKYHGKTDIGTRIGKILGKRLTKNANFDDVDMILPVPLHWERQRERGYNQSDSFAEGLADSMVRICHKDNLERKINTISQTKKSVVERIENVANIFEVKNPKLLEGKHILLVDDVVTTGATLEACAEAILKIPDTTVSMATIAITV